MPETLLQGRNGTLFYVLAQIALRYALVVALAAVLCIPVAQGSWVTMLQVLGAGHLFLAFALSLIIHWVRKAQSAENKARLTGINETQEQIEELFAMTDTLVRVAGTLLDKPGGYLTNDVLPPAVFLDNIPNWEFGVLQQVRDLARIIRNEYSRSQSQSREDPDIAAAEPRFFFDNDSWILPPTESGVSSSMPAISSARLFAQPA